MKALVCVSIDSCSYFMKKLIWPMHFRVGNPLIESFTKVYTGDIRLNLSLMVSLVAHMH